MNNGSSSADDVAHGGVGHVVVDVILQGGLRLLLGGFQYGGIEAADPAFGFVDGAAVDEALRQGVAVEAGDYPDEVISRDSFEIEGLP